MRVKMVFWHTLESASLPNSKFGYSLSYTSSLTLLPEAWTETQGLEPSPHGTETVGDSSQLLPRFEASQREKYYEKKLILSCRFIQGTHKVSRD